MKHLAWAAIAVAAYALAMGCGYAEWPPAHFQRIPTHSDAEPVLIKPAGHSGKQAWSLEVWQGSVIAGGRTYRFTATKREGLCLAITHALADALRSRTWGCRAVVRS